MKQITSTEFQKSYARLTEPHEVTALGRVILTVFPVGTLTPEYFGLGRETPLPDKPAKGKKP